ncbi:cobyrinic acid ac-diamide synthase, partial [Acinetobacter baumannii]|nr:cobyrinic acid ac-diamide synthase [Acinetobacter baumannii]
TTIIHERKIYRDVLAEGKGVIEANNAKAITEFSELMKELAL